VTPPSALASSEYRLPAVVRSLPVIVALKLAPCVQPLFLAPMDDGRLGKWSPMKNGRFLDTSLHDSNTAGTVAFNPVAAGETGRVLVARGPGGRTQALASVGCSLTSRSTQSARSSSLFALDRHGPFLVVRYAPRRQSAKVRRFRIQGVRFPYVFC
jgi:hypothetical protein